MTKSERKYGKIVSLRLRPENAYLVDLIAKDAKRTNERGKPIYSGKSEVLEEILIKHYADRFHLESEKTETE